MGKFTGARSLSEQEGRAQVHRGGRLSLRKPGKVEELDAEMSRAVGWEGSEHWATFFLPGLVFVSECVVMNTRT